MHKEDPDKLRETLKYMLLYSNFSFLFVREMLCEDKL